MVDLEVVSIVVVSDVRMAKAYVAVIFKNTLGSKKLVRHIANDCRLAELNGKMMYAVIEEGVDLGMLENMSWTKIIRFNSESEVPKIMNFLDKEVTYGRAFT